MEDLKRALNFFEMDLNNFKEEMFFLKQDIQNINQGFQDIYKILNNFKEKLDLLSKDNKNNTSTHIKRVPTEIKGSSTHEYPFKPSNTQNMGISIGNQGASTDRQTDRQTDIMIQKSTFSEESTSKNTIDSAAEIIDSLDNIKKQIRLKFKKLTDQETLVFSTIYQLEEENLEVNYKKLSEKLNLTESSIRDYVGRLIKKGIPLEKTKQNNKEISLVISPNLRKITTLNTILKLREL